VPAEPLPPSTPGGALILAAGFGRRFGSDKRQYPLVDGTPMLIATLARYAEVFEQLLVVLRPEDQALAATVSRTVPGIRPVFAADAVLGMGHSLAAGIRAAVNWDYACVGLGDMPYVTRPTLEALRDAWLAAGGERIVQPQHQGRPGHPVIFPRSDFEALSRLSGDQGARAILERSPERVLHVTVSDAGVLKDVDRPPAA
jgi:molybdenum cofactor cytidylyltransferase